MPKPLTELGEKWRGKEWREGQGEVVDRIHSTDKKFTLLQAPTGFGKSGVAGAAALWLPPSIQQYRMVRGKPYPPQSGILTGTLQLQKQYIDDFEDVARQVKGRGNFPCLVEERVTAADAYCTIGNPQECDAYTTCPYYAQRRAAEAASMVVHSYQYYMPSANFTGSFTDQSLLVLDEAHLIDEMLMNFVKCEVSKTTCDKFDVPYPKNREWSWEEWKNWADAFSVILDEQLSSLKGRAESDVQTRRLYRSGNALLHTMSMLNFSQTRWVCVPTMTGWEFMPVWIGEMAEDVLYHHANHVLLMSATILDYQTFAQVVGIDPQDVEFIDAPSSFPVGSKPVYYDPPMAVKGGIKEEGYYNPLLFGNGKSDGIYDIIRSHPNDKGLIHCVSFDIAKTIYANAPSDIRGRLITHSTGDRLEKYEYFKWANEPLVLLSPSMKEGVSLEDDTCRFIIVAKMPYPYLGSPQVKARMDTSLGKKWYPWKTMCDLIQMTGRGMRSKDDWCAVYIMDENFTRLFRQMRKWVPQNWLDDLHDARGLL